MSWWSEPWGPLGRENPGFLYHTLTLLVSAVTQNRNMRSLLTFLALLTVLAGSPQAQDFKPFQLYLAAGPSLALSHPTGRSDCGCGGVFSAELAYRISDIISVGARLQLGEIKRTVKDNIQGTKLWSQDIVFTIVYSLTYYGKYYFSNASFRPYGGFGTGVYWIDGYLATDTGIDFSDDIGGVVFGVYPRIGFDWWHLNCNVDVNLIPGIDTGVEVQGRRGTATFENSHLTFTLGFFLFGGKRA